MKTVDVCRTRESLGLIADTSISDARVARELDALWLYGKPPACADMTLLRQRMKPRAVMSSIIRSRSDVVAEMHEEVLVAWYPSGTPLTGDSGVVQAQR